MDRAIFSKLRNREKDCLRSLLVAGSSKGVADVLNIAPGTVDQHLKSARKTLGVTDSWAAATLLAEFERSAPQKMDNEPPTIARPAQSELVDGGSETTSRSENGHEYAARANLWKLLFPPLMRPDNTLSAQARVSLILIQTFIVAAGGILFIGVFYLLGRLLIALVTGKA